MEAQSRRPSHVRLSEGSEHASEDKQAAPVSRSAIAIFGAVIGWSSPSDASVQKIVIDQTATVNFTPIILGTSTPGTPTSYTIYLGRIFGELDPNDPTHSIITDIDHAPKNARQG